MPTIYMVTQLQIDPISMHHFTPIALMAKERMVAMVGPIIKVVKSTFIPSRRNGTMAFMTDVPPDAVARMMVTPTAAESFLPFVYSMVSAPSSSAAKPSCGGLAGDIRLP